MEAEQKMEDEVTTQTKFDESTQVQANDVPEANPAPSGEVAETETEPLKDAGAVVPSVEHGKESPKEVEAKPVAEEPVVAPRKLTAPPVQEAKVVAPAAHEAAKTQHPHPVTEYPKGVTFGCLLFTTEGNGELFIKWSDSPLPKTLALFTTTKKIPAFKLKTKTELLTNIAGNRKKFVSGLAAFFKEVDAHDGMFQILDTSDSGFGDVWVSVGGKKWGKEAGVPKKVNPGDMVDINTIEAVALLPHASAVFNGLLKIDIMRFLNTGTREGAVWHRS